MKPAIVLVLCIMSLVSVYAATSFNAESNLQSNSTSTSYVNKVSLTANITEPGMYAVVATSEVTATSATYSVYTRLTQNGTVLSETFWEPKDIAETKEFRMYATHTLLNLSATTYVFNIDYRTENALGTAKIRDARISLNKIDVYYQNSTESEQNQTSSLQIFNTLGFTPVAGTYIILSTGEYTSGSISDTTFVNLTLNGTDIGYTVNTEKDPTDYRPFAFALLQNLTNVPYTLQVKAMTESGTTLGRIRNIRNSVIKLPDGYYYSESLGSNSTTSLTPINKTILRFNLSSSAALTVFANGNLRGSGTSLSMATALRIDGIKYCDIRIEPLQVTAPSDDNAFLCHTNVSLSAGAHTAVIEFNAVDGGTATVTNARIIIFDAALTDPCVPPPGIDWTINTNLTCTNKNISTGAYSTIITSTGSLDLVNSNLVTSDFPNFDRDNMSWKLRLTRGNQLTVV